MRGFRKIASAATLGILSVAFLGGELAPRRAEASSHREAPRISQDPLADNTDVYAFVSPDAPSTVTLIANFIPLEEPASGPNFWKFDDNVLYEIKVDNNGDTNPDVTFQFRFRTQLENVNTFLYNTGPITSLNDPNWNIKQFVTVSMVKGGVTTVLGTELATPPVNIGPRSTPNYDALAAAAINTISFAHGNGKVFAGQRDEAFYVDLGSIFDLLGLRPFNQAHLIKLPTETGVDNTAGYNVHEIAIQVPIADLTTDGKGADSGQPVIGVWSTASRRSTRVISASGAESYSGPFRQVSRLGNPLINEVIIPLKDKDKWNTSQPSGDGQFLDYVTDPEPARLLPVLYPGVTVPAPPRNDLVAIFLTGIPGLNQPAGVTPSEQLRLNVSIAPAATENRLGLLGGDTSGFPNGRRVGDDVVDIELRALAGATPFTPDFNKSPNNILGDGVNQNDKANLNTFPYLPSPTAGYYSTHGSTAGSGNP